MQWFMFGICLFIILLFAKARPTKKCKDPVLCLVPPCQEAKPPSCAKSYTGLTCVDDYCRGCFAVWFDANGKEIDCDNTDDKYAGPDCKGLSVMDCPTNPCHGSPRPTCPEGRDAVCVPNYCEGCNAVWVTPKGKRLGLNCQCLDYGGRFDFSVCPGCSCTQIIARGEDFLSAACNERDVQETCCLTCSDLRRLKNLPAIC